MLVSAIHSAMISTFSGAWNGHQVKSYLSQHLPEILKDCPPDEIMKPDLAVAGPAIETLRHVLHEPILATALARLFAVAIDRRYATLAHPAFVSLIGNLSADEARLLMYFTKDEPLSVITLRWEYKPDTGKQGG